MWGEGDTFEEMCQAVANHPQHLKAPYLAKDTSFKVILSTVGFNWRPEQYKDYVYRTVEAVGFDGDVALENPQHSFWVITVDSDGESGMAAMPMRWVLARQIALGDRWGKACGGLCAVGVGCGRGRGLISTSFITWILQAVGADGTVALQTP